MPPPQSHCISEIFHAPHPHKIVFKNEILPTPMYVKCEIFYALAIFILKSEIMHALIEIVYASTMYVKVK